MWLELVRSGWEYSRERAWRRGRSTSQTDSGEEQFFPTSSISDWSFCVSVSFVALSGGYKSLSSFSACQMLTRLAVDFWVITNPWLPLSELGRYGWVWHRGGT